MLLVACNCQESDSLGKERELQTVAAVANQDGEVQGLEETKSQESGGKKNVDTEEIIRILEEEQIDFTASTHSQVIYILLKDGREYEGKYVHSEAGVYSKDPDLFDILNLAVHIKEKRPPEEVEDWGIITE